MPHNPNENASTKPERRANSTITERVLSGWRNSQDVVSEMKTKSWEDTRRCFIRELLGRLRTPGNHYVVTNCYERA